MRILINIFLLVAVSFCFAHDNGETRVSAVSDNNPADFKSSILDGVEKKIAEFDDNRKMAVADVVSHLRAHSTHQSTDPDAVVRPIYVKVQGLFEEATAELMQQDGSIDVVAVFHTPAPPTPLCLVDHTDDLVAPSLRSRPDSLDTVTFRKKTLQGLLAQEGYILNIFPQTGVKKRTDQQLVRYQQYKSEYPYHFHDIQVQNEISKDNVGATYLVRVGQDKWYVFAIRASQANAPKGSGDQWSLYFDRVDEQATHSEFKRIMEYLNGITENKLNNELHEIFGGGVRSVISFNEK